MAQNRVETYNFSIFIMFIFYIKCNGLTLISAPQLPRQTPICPLLFIIILKIMNFKISRPYITNKQKQITNR